MPTKPSKYALPADEAPGQRRPRRRVGRRAAAPVRLRPARVRLPARAARRPLPGARRRGRARRERCSCSHAGRARAAALGAARGRETVDEAEPEPVPTDPGDDRAAGAVRSSAEEADGWLAGCGATRRSRRSSTPRSRVLNRALRAQRAARGRPVRAEVSPSTVRSWRGWATAAATRWPTAASARRWSCRAPGARRAQPVDGGARGALRRAPRRARGGRSPAEELVLRARADLNAGRPARGGAAGAGGARGAAGGAGGVRGLRGRPAARWRRTARRSAAAANAALRGELPGDSAAALEEAVAAMELALKRRAPGRLERREHARQLLDHVAVQLHLGVGVVGRRALRDQDAAGRRRRASSPAARPPGRPRATSPRTASGRPPSRAPAPRRAPARAAARRTARRRASAARCRPRTGARRRSRRAARPRARSTPSRRTARHTLCSIDPCTSISRSRPRQRGAAGRCSA